MQLKHTNNEDFFLYGKDQDLCLKLRRAVFGICLENLIQAIWRIISLSLTIPFSAHKTLLQHKLVKYRVAFRVFWGALQALKSGKII